VFFISFMLMGTYVMLNLIIAVVLEKFVDSASKEGLLRTDTLFDILRRKMIMDRFIGRIRTKVMQIRAEKKKRNTKLLQRMTRMLTSFAPTVKKTLKETVVEGARKAIRASLSGVTDVGEKMLSMSQMKDASNPFDLEDDEDMTAPRRLSCPDPTDNGQHRDEGEVAMEEDIENFRDTIAALKDPTKVPAKYKSQRKKSSSMFVKEGKVGAKRRHSCPASFLQLDRLQIIVTFHHREPPPDLNTDDNDNDDDDDEIDIDESADLDYETIISAILPEIETSPHAKKPEVRRSLVDHMLSTMEPQELESRLRNSLRHSMKVVRHSTRHSMKVRQPQPAAHDVNGSDCGSNGSASEPPHHQPAMSTRHDHNNVRGSMHGRRVSTRVEVSSREVTTRQSRIGIAQTLNASVGYDPPGAMSDNPLPPGAVTEALTLEVVPGGGGKEATGSWPGSRASSTGGNSIDGLLRDLPQSAASQGSNAQYQKLSTVQSEKQCQTDTDTGTGAAE